MNMRKNIGLRLSQARKAKGLTQEQLAFCIGRRAEGLP